MNIFRDFNEIQSQMQRMFDQFDNNLASGPSKDFVREYQGPDGSKVRQVGPIVYWYSMTIGPDGKSVIQEFGNVKPSKDKVGMARRRPPLSAEREPLVDVNIMDD